MKASEITVEFLEGHDPRPCQAAIDLFKRVGTDEAEWLKHPGWIAWAIENLGLEVSDAQFAAVLTVRPWLLAYEHVCVRATDAQFAAVLTARPWLLAYEHVCARAERMKHESNENQTS